MVRDAINWTILAIVLTVAGWQVYTRYVETRPCAEPVRYSLGAVDPRFEVSRTTLLKDAQNAAQIWNKAAGKEVVVYDPEGPLTLNLVYDEREATAKLGIRITEAQAAQELQRVALATRQDEYESLQDSYNKKVSTINARGGATPQEARELDRERQALTSLGNAINTEVKAYNARVTELNTLVKQYNQAAGRVFEEGQYVRDSKGERINVFAFIGETQLTRVLTHEFGHAIGLGHNDNPNAIMYAMNESGNLKPAAEDLADLRRLCGLK
jgi:Matrixin